MLTNTPEDIKKKGIITGEMLNKHLTRLKEQSYGFQSEQQLDSVVIETFDFTVDQFNLKIIDDSKVPVRHKFKTFLEYSFVTARRKLDFKRSKFMGKELSSYDVSQAFDVFDKNFMVFIDGKLIDCVNIVPREGGIDLVLNIFNGTNKTGIPEDVFKGWVSSKSKGSIVFFSNSDFNPLITNREILRKNKKFLSLSDSGILDELESDSTYISFVTSNNHGYRSNLVDTTNKESLTSFFKELDSGTDNERSFLNIFGFRNLSEMVHIPSDTDVFQIPGYIMPIPVENILVFRDTPRGKEYADNITLKRSYPNFYEVEGNDSNDNLSLLIFYSPQNDTVVGYKNDLEVYYAIMGEGVDTFKGAPDIVKNYIPTEIEFSIKDFKSSGFDDHFEYKLYKMSQIADANPEHLRGLLKDQFETTDGVYINLKNVDLEDRIRYDNFQEIDNPSERLEFTEERYMITLKDVTENGKYKVNYFIDGLYYAPDIVCSRGKYDYIYIPSDIIKEDSYIEIERFLLYDNSKDVTFTANDRVTHIDITDDSFTRDNIYLTMNPSNEFVPDELYDVYIVDSSGLIKTFEVGDFTLIDKGRVFVKSKDGTLDDFNVTIHVDAYGKSEKVTSVGQANEHTHNIVVETKPKLDHIRVFNEDGKLIQSPYIRLEDSDTYLKEVGVTTLIEAEDGVEYIIEYTPNSYEVVMDIPKMPSNNIFYLKGIIDKPFDLKWFDVYVNGRKLNKNNVKTLSPYLIQIVNVQSAKNFVIYARNKYSDDIIPAPDAKSIIDILWETDPKFREGVMASDTNSSDTESDILSDLLYYYYQELEELFTKYFEFEFLCHINPDEPQITDEMIKKYPILFRYSTIIHLNGDEGIEKLSNPGVRHINPDVFREIDIDALNQYYKELEELVMGDLASFDLYRFNPDEPQITDEMINKYPNLFRQRPIILHMNGDDGLIADKDPDVMHIDPDATR